MLRWLQVEAETLTQAGPRVTWRCLQVVHSSCNGSEFVTLRSRSEFAA